MAAQTTLPQPGLQRRWTALDGEDVSDGGDPYIGYDCPRSQTRDDLRRGCASEEQLIAAKQCPLPLVDDLRGGFACNEPLIAAKQCFDRTQRSLWLKDTGTELYPVVDVASGYDQASLRTWRRDSTPGAPEEHQDQLTVASQVNSCFHENAMGNEWEREVEVASWGEPARAEIRLDYHDGSHQFRLSEGEPLTFFTAVLRVEADGVMNAPKVTLGKPLKLTAEFVPTAVEPDRIRYTSSFRHEHNFHVLHDSDDDDVFEHDDFARIAGFFTCGSRSTTTTTGTPAPCTPRTPRSWK